MIFEWSDDKAHNNRVKHGVPFEEAATAFGDPLSVTTVDPFTQAGETRFVLLGRAATGRLLVVVHTESGSTIRIISARPATRRERRPMKKPSPEVDDMQPEYDFRDGVRGKYAAEYAAGVNLVRLDADVAAAFPDGAAVNEALRVLMRVAKRAAKNGGRPTARRAGKA